MTPETATLDQVERRRDAIAAQLERLQVVGRSDDAGLAAAVAGLELDAWEMSTLRQALVKPDPDWMTLVAEGVAFKSRAMEDLDAADSDEGPGEHLALDAAVGLALMEETQRVIDCMVLAGKIEQAKHLTGFRNKLGHSVGALRACIGDEEFQHATAQSRTLVSLDSLQPANWEERSDAPTYIKKHGRSAKKKTKPVLPLSSRKKRSRSKIKPLLLVFAVAITSWMVFILPRVTQSPLPELTLQDVSPRSEIRSVAASPPSLYVQVDGGLWGELSKADRLGLVEDVARSAEAAGYTGANFTNEDGRTVARWLKLKGSKLVES